MRRGLILGACAVLPAVLFATMGLAASFPYDKLIVLGDSLSDTGNGGRFSNGPVWVEYLAQAAGTAVEPARFGGTNFAVGGARTHGQAVSLRGQADLLLSNWARYAPDRRTLFIVYGGANDLRAAVHVDDRQRVVDDAVRELQGIITDLIRAGATEVLVPNLPDIGRTPEAHQHGPAWVTEARKLAMRFNEQLETALRETEAQWPVRIHRFDVFGLLEQAAANPSRFGFHNVTSPCLTNGPSGDCEGYIFWDSMHPTTKGHARLAEAVRESLIRSRQ